MLNFATLFAEHSVLYTFAYRGSEECIRTALLPCDKCCKSVGPNDSGAVNLEMWTFRDMQKSMSCTEI